MYFCDNLKHHSTECDDWEVKALCLKTCGECNCKLLLLQKYNQKFFFFLFKLRKKKTQKCNNIILQNCYELGRISRIISTMYYFSTHWHHQIELSFFWHFYLGIKHLLSIERLYTKVFREHFKVIKGRFYGVSSHVL